MNPNIALGFQRPRFDPTEGQRNALAMRQAQMQEAVGMMQMDQAQRAAAKETRRTNALAGVDWNSPGSMEGARSALGKQGDFDSVMQIDNYMRGVTKDKREAAVAEIGILKDVGSLLATPETWGQGVAAMRQYAPDLGAQIPDEFNPQVADGFNRMALGAKGWMEKQDADRKFQETKRHNKETEATARIRAGNSGPLAMFSGADGSVTAIGGPNGIGPGAMGMMAVGKGQIKQRENEGKEVGAHFGRKYAELLTLSDEALMDNSRLDRLDSLLTNVDTGKFKGSTNEIKKAAKSMGIDLDAVGVTDDVAPVEAAKSLAGELTLSAVKSAKLTPVSNTDLMYMDSLQPGIETTPDGRKLVIQTRKALNKRSIEIAKMAAKYRKQYGAIDETFQEMTTQFAEENPLFRAIKSDDDYNDVPSGDYFMAPDGSVRKKP